MFDCHVHSDFSTDSRLSAQAACDAAKDLGLKGIAFTDHLDIDYPDTDESFNIDFDKYVPYMTALKERQSPGFKVSVGIEVGIQPHVLNESLDVVRSYNFDYVLASVHIIEGIDIYGGAYSSNRTRNEAYERYLREILFMVRNFPDFDNVGHLEYVTRYTDYDDRSLRYKDHSDTFDELLKDIIHRGKGLEVNTGSFRDKTGKTPCEFDIAILKRYRELGGEIICLGSDSHDTEHIGYKFDLFKEIIIESGFSHAAYFDKRKPVFYKL